MEYSDTPRRPKSQLQIRAAVRNRWKGENESVHHDQEPWLKDEISSAMEVDYEEEENSDSKDYVKNLTYKLDLAAIDDWFEICKDWCRSRKLSFRIYRLLRHVNFIQHEIDDILRNIGAYRCKKGLISDPKFSCQAILK